MFRFSLRFKITFLVTTVVAVTSTTLGAFTFRDMKDVLDNAAGIGALTAAATIASTLDPTLVEDGPQAFTSSSYLETANHLDDAIVTGTLELVRVLKHSEDGTSAEVVFDLPEKTAPEYLPPGTVIRHGDPLDSLLLWQSRPGRILWKFEDVTKKIMVGWAPVMNGDRQVGLVLVGVDITSISHALITLLMAIVVACLLFTLLSGLVVFKFASTFEKSAVTDGLMGIYNHKYFKQRLEQEVSKARRYGQATSLVLLDIDFFKRVNDTYGHTTGDITLKTLAKWVSDSVRTTDVVARYGGEEIAIILTHTGIAGAQEFAERLRLKISQQVVKDPGEKAEFRVTVSIGVAQWEKGMDMLDMIKRADAALYHSKRTGRNRVTIYQEEILPAPEPQASQAKSR